MIKPIVLCSMLGLLILAMTNPIYATETSPAPVVKIETAIHFLVTDGSDVLVQPGTYQLEVAEDWLRLVPGERRDALLLDAHQTQHEENLHAPKALLQEEERNEYRLALLLPGGTGLEAIGSVSGIRSRAVKRPLTSRTRAQQQTSRIPTRSKQSVVVQKSKRPLQSPKQPNNPLAQRVQTLEQQVSSLQNIVTTLQSQLNRVTSAIQIDNAGQVTISSASTVTVQGNIVKISASTIKADAGISKFSGVVQADTLITNSVASKSYTPGAGNIW